MLETRSLRLSMHTKLRVTQYALFMRLSLSFLQQVLVCPAARINRDPSSYRRDAPRVGKWPARPILSRLLVLGLNDQFPRAIEPNHSSLAICHLAERRSLSVSVFLRSIDETSQAQFRLRSIALRCASRAFHRDVRSSSPPLLYFSMSLAILDFSHQPTRSLPFSRSHHDQAPQISMTNSDFKCDIPTLNGMFMEVYSPSVIFPPPSYITYHSSPLPDSWFRFLWRWVCLTQYGRSGCSTRTIR